MVAVVPPRNSATLRRHARRAAWRAVGRLPPGFVADLDQRERDDRRFIVDHAAAVGPIFSATAWGQFWVCVVGTERCRRLLADHDACMTPYTLDVGALFAGGFMRQMAGQLHDTYRGRLGSALRKLDVASLDDEHAMLVAEHLGALRREQASQGASAEALRRHLSHLATDLLVADVLAGCPAAGDVASRIAGLFRELGPHGVVWNIAGRQVEAYQAISVEVRRLVEGPTPGFRAGLAGFLEADGQLDDTMLGNLIYMVEIGRFDLASLFRWLVHFVVQQPEAARQIASAPHGPIRRAVAAAFVSEVLRHEQSERLARVVDRSFRFDGYVVPAGSMVRLCMWESHKDPVSFTDPWSFDPNRFVNGDVAARHFSPFGLDQHGCPFASYTVQVGAVFVEQLASNFSPELVIDGPPVRGPYHFEPSPLLTVALGASDAT